VALNRAGLDEGAATAAAASVVLLARLCTLWFAVVVGVLATAVFSRLELVPNSEIKT